MEKEVQRMRDRSLACRGGKQGGRLPGGEGAWVGWGAKSEVGARAFFRERAQTGWGHVDGTLWGGSEGSGVNHGPGLSWGCSVRSLGLLNGKMGAGRIR